MLRTVSLALLAMLAFAAPGAQAYTERCPDPAPMASRAAPDPAKSATLLFIPGPVRTPQPVMTADLDEIPQFAVGLFSPTLGRYSPTQMMLDISQGSRVASSLYKPVAPAPPGLIDDDGCGELLGWDDLVDRANAVPGDIVPGSLGEAIGQDESSWTNVAGGSTISAIAGARKDGTVYNVSSEAASELGSALVMEQTMRSLVVAALPPGGVGYGIARQLARAQPERLILIVQAPPDPARTRLLTIAMRDKVGSPASLTSATTRRNGMVAATDIAPTILKRLGIAEPADMQGQPIETAPYMTPAELNAMNDRLALIAGRRAPLGKNVLMLGCVFLIFLLLAGRLTGRFPETARLAARLVGLAVLWLPLMLLITAWVRPSRALEVDIAVFGSLVLAFVTDKLVRWPRALWVPALAVIVAHAIDFLVFDAKFTGESLLGSNPLYGARFFGVGNELEVVASVSAVMGLGAWLSDRGTKYPARWFAGGGVLLALFLGAGRLGADVGGVIFAAAAFGAAAVYVTKMRFTPLRIALIVLLPILGLVAIGLLDAVSSGESHLTRTVFEAQSAGDLWKVVDRRFQASVEGAKSDGIWVLVIISVLLLFWAWLKREKLFSRLVEAGDDPAERRPYRAGMVGGLAGTLVGAAANDSGPAILIIGTIYLCMGLLYLRGRPISRILEQ